MEPAPTRQYLACRFNQWSRNYYTYHWDGEPLAVGDLVKVAASDGLGWKRVEVMHIDQFPPNFETKPILGKIEKEEQ